MEKLSRVKKYQDLRKSIELDNPVDIPHAQDGEPILSAPKEFNSSLLKKVEIKEEGEQTAKRAKSMDSIDDKKERTIDDTFTNEYLDDFMKEVRDYNIRKGNRETDNTQADILYQLNSANRAKRSHYIQEINEVVQDDEKKVVDQQNIALEVQNLIHQDEEDIYATGTIQKDLLRMYGPSDTQELPVKEELIQPVKKLIEPAYTDLLDVEDKNEENDIASDDVIEANTQILAQTPDSELHQKLVEETQQLRIQMDEYEEELTDLSDGVEKTNKLLNFILCFLILVLLAIIGFIAYGVWKAGGI